ncbi:MAG TPA: hypothetical protein VGO55_03060 [Allosphingosinicella sp.]|jgi:hypothetical protein|nr:hypothetical protein [Allosphingosinicella sp.]
MIAEARRSATAALSLAVSAILFAQIIVPGAAWLLPKIGKDLLP